MVASDMPQMTIWPMCIACWIQTRSEYVISVAFLRQKWLGESTLLPQCYVVRTLPVIYHTAYAKQLLLNINAFGYV